MVRRRTRPAMLLPGGASSTRTDRVSLRLWHAIPGPSERPSDLAERLPKVLIPPQCSGSADPRAVGRRGSAAAHASVRVFGPVRWREDGGNAGARRGSAGRTASGAGCRTREVADGAGRCGPAGLKSRRRASAHRVVHRASLGDLGAEFGDHPRTLTSTPTAWLRHTHGRRGRAARWAVD